MPWLNIQIHIPMKSNSKFRHFDSRKMHLKIMRHLLSILFHNQSVNSLWPSDITWRNRSELTLAPVKAFSCHYTWWHHKGQWCRALFSLICTWINGWVNNREAGDLRCHHTHYDVFVLRGLTICDTSNWSVLCLIITLTASGWQQGIIWLNQ